MERIKIKFLNNNEAIEFNKGITYGDLYTYYKNNYNFMPYAFKVNNKLKNWNEKITKDISVLAIDYHDISGYKVCQVALKFMVNYAVKELYGDDSNVLYLNSLDKGTYFEISSRKIIDKEEVSVIKNKLLEIIKENIKFNRVIVEKKDACNYFNIINEKEKIDNIMAIPGENVTLYKLGKYYNYFYSPMPFSTEAIKLFDLVYISNNHLVLLYPTPRNNELNYNHFPKTLNIFEEYRSWLKNMNTMYVADLNNVVASGDINDYIACNEMAFNDKLSLVTQKIISDEKNIKFVLIAGPSSSGKTTTSKRLKLNLKRYGINSYTLSTDDYFKNRVDTPKDENGNYEFEVVEALDLDLLKSDLDKLLHGEEINPPVFNFLSGEKEFKNKKFKLNDGEVVIIEGLHSLNERLTSNIHEENKFKIYVSPFTGLELDRHNHISTVDSRLLRRIIRDNRTRGYDVSQTINTWQKVRNDEEKYIYPYQDNADVIINTALIYELGVIKVFAEPLLLSVSVDSIYYEESRRLLGFLRIFYPISPELVPKESVLREFIGGSKFE